MISVSFVGSKFSWHLCSMCWGILIYTLSGDYVVLAMLAYSLLHGFEISKRK